MRRRYGDWNRGSACDIEQFSIETRTLVSEAKDINGPHFPVLDHFVEFRQLQAFSVVHVGLSRIVAENPVGSVCSVSHASCV